MNNEFPNDFCRCLECGTLLRISELSYGCCTNCGSALIGDE